MAEATHPDGSGAIEFAVAEFGGRDLIELEAMASEFGLNAAIAKAGRSGVDAGFHETSLTQHPAGLQIVEKGIDSGLGLRPLARGGAGFLPTRSGPAG